MLTEEIFTFLSLGELQPESTDLFLTIIHIFMSKPSFLHSFNASSATTFKSITFSPRTLKSLIENRYNKISNILLRELHSIINAFLKGFKN